MSELTSIRPALSHQFGSALVEAAAASNTSAIALKAFDGAADNRLYQTAAGDLQVAPKPIGFIIGEKVIRPMIDGVAYVWSKLPSFTLPGASAITYDQLAKNRNNDRVLPNLMQQLRAQREKSERDRARSDRYWADKNKPDRKGPAQPAPPGERRVDSKEEL